LDKKTLWIFARREGIKRSITRVYFSLYYIWYYTKKVILQKLYSPSPIQNSWLRHCLTYNNWHCQLSMTSHWRYFPSPIEKFEVLYTPLRTSRNIASLSSNTCYIALASIGCRFQSVAYLRGRGGHIPMITKLCTRYNMYTIIWI